MMMISSNIGNALRMTDSWPIVKGSNEPGKTAILFISAFWYHKAKKEKMKMSISLKSFLRYRYF